MGKNMTWWLVFQKLLIYWDHTQLPLGFTENDPKKEKIQSVGVLWVKLCHSCLLGTEN